MNVLLFSHEFLALVVQITYFELVQFAVSFDKGLQHVL